MHHLHREWTKVMQAAEGHFARVIHFLNAGHERNPDPVTELDMAKTELALDLAQHLITGLVPAGIPAGRKGNHRGAITPPELVALLERPLRLHARSLRRPRDQPRPN